MPAVPGPADDAACPFCGSLPRSDGELVCPAVLAVSGLVLFHESVPAPRPPPGGAASFGGALRLPETDRAPFLAAVRESKLLSRVRPAPPDGPGRRRHPPGA